MADKAPNTATSIGCLILVVLVVGYFVYTFIRVDHPELIGQQFVPVNYSQAQTYFRNNIPKGGAGSSWENSICYNEEGNQIDCLALKSYDFSVTFTGYVESDNSGDDEIWCGEYRVYDSVSKLSFNRLDCYVIKMNPNTNEYYSRAAIQQTDYSKYLD